MRKFLLYSSALALGLSGVAEAACIQTPTCSSLGYTSTSSCTGGTKCPFGNYWNCTASDLNDKITEITNKITEIEKNNGSGPRCADCEVGDFVCGGQCLSGRQATFTAKYSAEYSQRTLSEIYTFCTDVVVEKTNGVCKKVPTKYSENQTKRLTYDEFMKGATITKDDYGEIIRVFNEEVQNAISAACLEQTKLRIDVSAYYSFYKESKGYIGVFGKSTSSDYAIDSTCTSVYEDERGTSVLDVVKSYIPAEGMVIPNVTTFY